MRFAIFALIPLILSMGIVPAIPFSDASEYSQICVDKVWIENSKGRIACVTPTTADKLEQRGWGSLLSDDVIDGNQSDVVSLELPPYPDQPSVNPQALEFAKNMKSEVIKVTDGVYQAVFFGSANIIMVEGDDGIIILDSGESYEQAKEVLEEFRKITDKPVVAVILSNSISDHATGTRAFVEDGNDVKIYAHETFMEEFAKQNSLIAPILNKRTGYWGGLLLPQEGDDRWISSGISSKVSIGTFGFLPPTDTFDKELELELAGINLKLIHHPGVDPEHVIVWLPDKNVVWLGNQYVEGVFNILTPRGGSYRDPLLFIQNYDQIRSWNPEYVVTSHGRPHIGQENSADALTAYRDRLAFLHDQTIRHINMGLSPDELVEAVKLPDYLKNHPVNQEWYTEFEWQVRGVYSGNIGWFNGDASFFKPVSPEVRSQEILNGFGGIDNTISSVREAIIDGKYEWAAELATYILDTNPDNENAKLLKAQALRILGQQSTSSGARNWYLSQALELEDKAPESISYFQTSNALTYISNEVILSQFSSKLNPEKSGNAELTLGILIEDLEEGHTIQIRKAVMEYQSQLPDNYDVFVTTNDETFKKLVSGQVKIEDAINSGDVLVDGDVEELFRIISYFDRGLESDVDVPPSD